MNKWYSLKIFQIYVPTFSHSHKEAKNSHEDVQVASERAKALFTKIMEDFKCVHMCMLYNNKLNTGLITSSSLVPQPFRNATNLFQLLNTPEAI